MKISCFLFIYAFSLFNIYFLIRIAHDFYLIQESKKKGIILIITILKTILFYSMINDLILRHVWKIIIQNIHFINKFEIRILLMISLA